MNPKEGLLSALSVVVVVLAAFLARPMLSMILHTNVPMAVVSSWSMEPVLHVGDMIVVVGAHEINEGKIILFKSPVHGRLVVHRVVGVSEEGYVTKGDANAVPDYVPVPPRNVHGEVLLVVPYLGVLRLVVGKLLGL